MHVEIFLLKTTAHKDETSVEEQIKENRNTEKNIFKRRRTEQRVENCYGSDIYTDGRGAKLYCIHCKILSFVMADKSFKK